MESPVEPELTVPEHKIDTQEDETKANDSNACVSQDISNPDISTELCDKDSLNQSHESEKVDRNKSNLTNFASEDEWSSALSPRLSRDLNSPVSASTPNDRDDRVSHLCHSSVRNSPEGNSSEPESYISNRQLSRIDESGMNSPLKKSSEVVNNISNSASTLTDSHRSFPGNSIKVQAPQVIVPSVVRVPIIGHEIMEARSRFTVSLVLVVALF